MSNYTKTTNFSAKDALPSGDSGKIVKGTELDTEFDNIQTSNNTKANKVSGITVGNAFQAGTGGDLADAGYDANAIPVTELDITGSTATTTLHADDEIIMYSGDATANRAIKRTDFQGGTDLTKVMHKLFHARYEAATGAGGGAASGLSWNDANLNTDLTTEHGSRSGDTITLAAGTYYIEAYACGYKIGDAWARWYNVTDTAVELIGSVAVTGTTEQGYVFVTGRFTIAGSKDFKLQVYAESANGTDGLGKSNNYNDKVYTDIRIWEIG